MHIQFRPVARLGAAVQHKSLHPRPVSTVSNRPRDCARAATAVAAPQLVGSDARFGQVRAVVPDPAMWIAACHSAWCYAQKAGVARRALTSLPWAGCREPGLALMMAWQQHRASPRHICTPAAHQVHVVKKHKNVSCICGIAPCLVLPVHRCHMQLRWR